MVKVQLKGLNIYPSRGKWYVYIRSTGVALLKGFEGDKDALLKRLAMPDMVGAYNARRNREHKSYPDKTLGKLVHWFTIGDIDRTAEQRKAKDRFDGGEGYPKWKKLAQATREDYLDAFEYLRDEFDIPLSDITQPDLYKLRDKCGQQKFPRFADKMISALSSMFSQGAKRGDMLSNPCLGMDRAHSADPNANREWTHDEWTAACNEAPLEVKIPLMIARHAGLRGQSIVAVSWKQYQDHPLTGKCFRFVAAKNDEKGFVPTTQELQDFLETLPKCSTLIAVRDNGTLWASEKEMQTRVSHWLRDMERKGMIGAGTTLHGLRVSYAAWLSRHGANDKEVASSLGDKSTRMGAHYTRHVENEANVIRAFTRVKKET